MLDKHFLPWKSKKNIQPMDTNCNRRGPLESVLAYYYLSWIFNCMKESHVFILNTKTYSQYLKLKICLNLIGNIKAIFKLHGFSFPLKHLVKFISDKKALPKNSFFGKKNYCLWGYHHYLFVYAGCLEIIWYTLQWNLRCTYFLNTEVFEFSIS